jgi:hypothetical protein
LQRANRHTAHPVDRREFLLAGGDGRNLLKLTVIFREGTPGLVWSAAQLTWNRFRAFWKYFVRTENHPPGSKDPTCAGAYVRCSSRKDDG